mmetsp:Transcript_12203/g.29007  ORF Transcript_12203/g.29007 Transcript_12203/m.29007 type:complete len:590 (+) Transcript_12203:53-1822(+)
MADIDAFQFFKDELSNFQDDSSERRKILGRITLIAGALGKAETLEKLVPFLNTCATTDPYDKDDEFLFLVAREYKHMPDHLPPDEWRTLVPPLESLGTQDETLVREEAIKTLSSLVAQATQKNLAFDTMLPVLRRLSGADWFSPRCSACMLFPAVYGVATDTVKAELRKEYIALCNDDTPMVKRAAARSLAALVSVVDKKDFFADIMPTFTKLAAEDTDVVRVEMVKVLVSLCRILDASDAKEHVVDRVAKACTDKSWRVRLQIARSLVEFCKGLSPALASELVKVWGDLLKDQQREVKITAIMALKDCMPLVSAESIQTHVTPRFQELASDFTTDVRTALAKVIGYVAAHIGRAGTLQGEPNLLATIMELLKDEFAEVRLNVVAQTGKICEVLGIDPVQQLLNTLHSLAMDNNWRIRMEVVQQIPLLGAQFGTELFQTKLQGLFLGFLADSVHAVRLAAVDNVEPIAKAFGATWTAEHFMPKLLEQNSATQSYLNRLTSLHALSKVSCVLSADQVAQLVVPVLVEAMKDKVPNVKFCSCRIIKELADEKKLSSASISGKLKPAVSELRSQDADGDVQVEARRVLEVIG